MQENCGPVVSNIRSISMGLAHCSEYLKNVVSFVFFDWIRIDAHTMYIMPYNSHLKHDPFELA